MDCIAEPSAMLLSQARAIAFGSLLAAKYKMVLEAPLGPVLLSSLTLSKQANVSSQITFGLQTNSNVRPV